MNLRRLRDDHGRMYEIPLLIMIVLLGLAIGIPRGGVTGVLMGLLIALVGVFGILFALAGLGMFAARLEEVRWIAAILENPAVRLFRASFIWVLMFLFFGGLANLFAFVLLDQTSLSARLQVVLSAAAAVIVGGLATVLIYRSNQKNTPRF